MGEPAALSDRNHLGTGAPRALRLARWPASRKDASSECRTTGAARPAATGDADSGTHRTTASSRPRTTAGVTPSTSRRSSADCNRTGARDGADASGEGEVCGKKHERVAAPRTQRAEVSVIEARQLPFTETRDDRQHSAIDETEIGVHVAANSEDAPRSSAVAPHLMPESNTIVTAVNRPARTVTWSGVRRGRPGLAASST